MLNKREREVMQAVYTLCKTNGRCLASPLDLIKTLRGKWTEEGLENVLQALEMDGYFEMISSERLGERMYVITLLARGHAFQRDGVQLRRDLVYKIFWSVASAVVAFLVGVLLRHVF